MKMSHRIRPHSSAGFYVICSGSKSRSGLSNPGRHPQAAGSPSQETTSSLLILFQGVTVTRFPSRRPVYSFPSSQLLFFLRSVYMQTSQRLEGPEGPAAVLVRVVGSSLGQRSASPAIHSSLVGEAARVQSWWARSRSVGHNSARRGEGPPAWRSWPWSRDHCTK